MNEIIALQKYENEAQLAKELIRGFWLAHGDYVITDEEAAENLAAWTDKGHVFYFILKEEIPIGFVHLGYHCLNTVTLRKDFQPENFEVIRSEELLGYPLEVKKYIK